MRGYDVSTVILSVGELRFSKSVWNIQKHQEDNGVNIMFERGN